MQTERTISQWDTVNPNPLLEFYSLVHRSFLIPPRHRENLTTFFCLLLAEFEGHLQTLSFAGKRMSSEEVPRCQYSEEEELGIGVSVGLDKGGIGCESEVEVTKWRWCQTS